MKNQVRSRFHFAALLILGLLGKSTEVNAQSFYFTNLMNSPVSNIVHQTIVFQFYQNCVGGIGLLKNIPVGYSVNNGAFARDTIAGILPFGGGSKSPLCNGQAPICNGTGPISYEESASMVFTIATGYNVSGPGLTNISTQLFPGTGFGNYQAANISGPYSVQPEIFNALNIGMVNRLPYFNSVPVIFVNVNQPVRYNGAAKDQDGDSLVYRLRAVSSSATYATGFSYQNPITANPALALNSRTGEITFTPTHFDQTSGIGGVANTYIVGIDVDEYRKINGQPTKIGTNQQNLIVNVVGSTNNTPVLTASRNGTPIAPNTIIDVLPGTPLILDFTATDANASDIIATASNTQNMLPGSTFSTTSGQNPKSGQITWVPTSAHVRKEPYFFTITATDNGCPYAANTTSTFGVRVKNVTGTKKEITGTGGFYAYPNPFTKEVGFRINTFKEVQSILIYNSLGQEIDRIELQTIADGEQEINWDKAFAFPAGQYVAQLQSNGLLKTIKFIRLP